MDIECAEWDVFYQDFLTLPEKSLPVQLWFELHLAPSVKDHLDRDLQDVINLFADLYKVGYHTGHREKNNQFCSEFTMLHRPS